MDRSIDQKECTVSDIKKEVDQSRSAVEAGFDNHRKHEPRWIALYLLLGLNLALTATFGTLLLLKPSSPISGSGASTSMPTGLTVEQLNKTADLLVKSYNEKNLDALYDIFGQYAKTQVKKEEIGKILTGISSFGKISATTFVSIELTNTTGLGKWYQARFSTMYESGPGMMNITFLDRGGKLEVVSYKFDVGN